MTSAERERQKIKGRRSSRFSGGASDEFGRPLSPNAPPSSIGHCNT